MYVAILAGVLGRVCSTTSDIRLGLTSAGEA